MTSPATGSCLDLKYKVWVPTSRGDFQPIRGIDHAQNIGAVVECLELSWQDGHFWDLELDSWVGQMINALSWQL